MANFIISQRDLDEFGQFTGTVESDTIEPEIFGDETNYRILGLDGDDSIQSGAGEDTLFGMEGNDTVSSRSGDDLIFGNQGDDSLDGFTGSDTIYGGQGDDTIINGGLAVGPFNGIESFFGNLGNDSIVARQTIDAELYGGKGDDTLVGSMEGGSDTLSGDKGQDVISGGFGEDIFIIAKTANPAEIPNLNENADLILDFTPDVDKIGLAGVSFNQLAISEITPNEIDAIFGNNTVDDVFSPSIIRFIKVEADGELLAVLGRDRDNFTLIEDDFVII
ncbi:MAG: calcium-binding protein [Cyanobacteriota bacterium]|nr:calcium-binding protein [Cyanobacteriota bacterium]